MHAVKMQEWLSCFYKIVTELRFEQNCFKSGFWRCCCCRCVAAVVAAVTVVAAVAVVGATPKRHSRKSLRVIGKKVFSQIEKVSSISETLWSRIVKTFNFETSFEEKKRKFAFNDHNEAWAEEALTALHFRAHSELYFMKRALIKTRTLTKAINGSLRSRSFNLWGVVITS